MIEQAPDTRLLRAEYARAHEDIELRQEQLQADARDTLAQMHTDLEAADIVAVTAHAGNLQRIDFKRLELLGATLHLWLQQVQEPELLTQEEKQQLTDALRQARVSAQEGVNGALLIAGSMISATTRLASIVVEVGEYLNSQGNK